VAEAEIKITADTTDAQRALGNLDRALGNLSDTANLASRALGAVIGAASISAFIDFADSATTLTNRLRQVTSSSEELARVQKAVFDISNKTGQQVKDVAQLYQRLSMAQDTAGLTGAGVVKMTELISKSLAASGLTAQETSSVLLQLSQAFNSGKLQGDEFRSIMEASPQIMHLVAKSMGVTVGELKKLGSEGKITGEILRNAFLDNMDEIEANFGKRTETISNGITRVKNAATQLWMEFDTTSGVSAALGSALGFVAEHLDKIVISTAAFIATLAVERIVAATIAMGGLEAAILAVNAAIAKNWIAILIAGLAWIGTEIYQSVIKPMNDAGINSKTIALYIAQNLINAFLQVGEAAIAIFPSIGKFIADTIAGAISGAPVEAAKKSLSEINAIMGKILTTQRVKLVSDADLASIDKALTKTKDLKKATDEVYKKPAQVVSDDKANKAAERALANFEEHLKNLRAAAQYDRDRINLGIQEAALMKEIADQSAKLEKAGLKMTDTQKARLTLAFEEAQEAKAYAAVMEQVNKLNADSNRLKYTDVGYNAVLAATEGARLQYGKAFTAELESQLQSAMFANQVAVAGADVARTVLDLANQNRRLGIVDVAVRKESEAVDALRVKHGRALSDEAIGTLRSAIQENQVKVANADIESQIARFKEEGYRLSQGDALVRQQLEATDAARLKYGFALTVEKQNELAAAVRQLSIERASAAIKQQLLTMGQESKRLATQDVALRNQQQAIDSARLQYGSAFTDEQEQQLRAAVQQQQIDQARDAINQDLVQSQMEQARLSISDLNTREQQAAVDQARVKYGSALTQELEAQVRASVAQTQATKEALAVDEARRAISGTMTTTQAIGRAPGVVAKLDPTSNTNVQFAQDQQALEAARANALITEDQYNQMIIKLETQKSQALYDIRKREMEDSLRMAGVTNTGILDAVSKSMDNVRLMQQGGLQAATGTVDQLAYVFGQLGTYNKDAFRAAKAFNVASALINTYMGATKALATFPPPFNFIAAAAVVAAGLAQVAAIRSQTFSGRQLGGPVMGGQTYMVGEAGPELFTPATTGTITPNNQLNGGNTTVNFNISTVDASGFDRLLLSRRGMITGIIAEAQLEKGRRA